MTTIKTALQSDWGQPLQRFARELAPILVATFAAGWWLGHQIHTLNDWLVGKYQPPARVMALPPAAPLALPPAAPLPGWMRVVNVSLDTEVRLLAASGMGRRKIAKTIGVSEYKVRSILQAKQ